MLHLSVQNLLRRYADDDLSPHQYVEETLDLLGTCKNRLKVRRTRQRLRPARREFDTA